MTVRLPVRPHHKHTNENNTTGNSRCFRREIVWPPGLLERKKKQTKSRVFFDVIFYVYKWITEKELERVIENKGNEFRRKKNIKIS